MQAAVIASPKTGRELVDEYFIENRTRLLEIAAFLDRLDRADGALAQKDYRARAFHEALALLGAPREGSSPETRVQRMQMLFSDPTTAPQEQFDVKSARGAYDRWQVGLGR